MTCGIINPESARQAALESVAQCIGTQDFGDGMKLELWNLCTAIPGFPRLVVGSTYARRTLEEALFPNTTKPEPHCAGPVAQPDDRSAVESPEITL